MKRVVYVEASDCDEAADIALEDFKAEPQPDDVEVRCLPDSLTARCRTMIESEIVRGKSWRHVVEQRAVAYQY